MKHVILMLVLILLPIFLHSQTTAASEPNSVTVPMTLDHNRIVIDVYLPLPDGSTKRVRGWVDNGNPELTMSRNAASLMKLNITCDDKTCSAPPPAYVMIQGMKMPLSGVKTVNIPRKPPSAAEIMEPGMSAEINIPSTVLRNYDVLVNFPEREFTIAKPGGLKFQGTSSKVLINSTNGLIQIPSKVAEKKYNLGLDLGASINFLSEDLYDKLAAANPDWPHMTGAVGPADMWGTRDEANWKIMRIARAQFGPLYLTSVPVVRFAKADMSFFENRAAVPTAGLIGSEALLNYRIGLDYAHSMVYFDIGSTFRFPDFDVVGITLRPDDDGRFTIIGVPQVEGKPAVGGIEPGDHLVRVDSTPVAGSTMGQVWSMLEGQPGQQRKLTIERGGKQFTTDATVEHFLAESPKTSEEHKRRAAIALI